MVFSITMYYAVVYGTLSRTEGDIVQASTDYRYMAECGIIIISSPLTSFFRDRSGTAVFQSIFFEEFE